MTTQQYESATASTRAADERREQHFERVRNRGERIFVVIFIGVCGCAEILLILAVAYR